MVNIQNDWDEVLREDFSSPAYLAIREKLKAEYLGGGAVYPPMGSIFSAFKATPYSEVKAVIIGQDPYHNPGQAHGMCFSVPPGVDAPPSLINIYKEINSDLGLPVPSSGNLERWAGQGVLLLNSVLTVRAGQAASHRFLGWEEFTDNVIRKLNARETPLVFMLWGRFAISKKELVTSPLHLVLTAPHPSPLSAYNGFFGCRHFSRANAFLVENGITPIDWRVENP